MSKAILLFLLLVLAQSCSQQNEYPNEAHKLSIDPKKLTYYDSLIAPIGLQTNRQYSYTEYADITRENEIGTAGNYDYLLLSTGGNSWQPEDVLKFNEAGCGWEITYYKTHDLTLLHEACKKDKGKVRIRILKASKGRNEKLYLGSF